MKTMIMLMLVATIALAGIVNPSTNDTVVFSYDNGPAGQESEWFLLDMTGRIMDSGMMPDGIRDAYIIVDYLPSGVYGCIIVAEGEIVESGIFTKL